MEPYTSERLTRDEALMGLQIVCIAILCAILAVGAGALFETYVIGSPQTQLTAEDK